jgi:hypothetical protein
MRTTLRVHPFLNPNTLAFDPLPPPARTTGALATALVARHLVRVLKTADSLQTLDAAGVAIQELLKCCAALPELLHCSGSAGGGGPSSAERRSARQGNALFGSLSEDVQARGRGGVCVGVGGYYIIVYVWVWVWCGFQRGAVMRGGGMKPCWFATPRAGLCL